MQPSLYIDDEPLALEPVCELVHRRTSWSGRPMYEPAPPVDHNPWYSETAYEQKDTRGSTVYLIEAGEHYKVGITTDLVERLASINGGLPHAPAAVVAVRAGGRELEARLHHALDHRRVKGEWFNKCDEVYRVFLAMPQVPVQDEQVA
jgi:hypothetical protein